MALGPVNELMVDDSGTREALFHNMREAIRLRAGGASCSCCSDHDEVAVPVESHSHRFRLGEEIVLGLVVSSEHPR